MTTEVDAFALASGTTAVGAGADVVDAAGGSAAGGKALLLLETAVDLIDGLRVAESTAGTCAMSAGER